eukprot:TRINITY_DN9216_c0_g1_i2.p1 TRINITY_DN9216_c0_g1~~TRINITY_DN9216_c0_g1_i2.p1  ORF type:complete len:126 (-),score=8.72 TRINITY_DN9216_c0_g1_i2:827-1204(-)
MKALGGKMNVLLGAMSGAFEGVNASTFTVELGSHIRRIAPYDKPTWVMVDEGTREAVYVAVSQKFDFGWWKTDQVVKKTVHKLAMHIYIRSLGPGFTGSISSCWERDMIRGSTHRIYRGRPGGYS